MSGPFLWYFLLLAPLLATEYCIPRAVSPLQHGGGEEEGAHGLQGLRREGTGGSPEDKQQRQKQQRRAQQGHAKEVKVSHRCAAGTRTCMQQCTTGCLHMFPCDRVHVYLSRHP